MEAQNFLDALPTTISEVWTSDDSEKDNLNVTEHLETIQNDSAEDYESD